MEAGQRAYLPEEGLNGLGSPFGIETISTVVLAPATT